MSEIMECSSLLPDEDGSEFERELTEALKDLSITATTDKLSKVQSVRLFLKLLLMWLDKMPETFSSLVQPDVRSAQISLRNLLNTVSVLQQACKNTCSQITDMTKPEEDQSEDDVKERVSVEVWCW